MVPERLAIYRKNIPMLDEVTDWQLLRKWALSEVYRVSLQSGESRIVKWGGREMAREFAVYQKLLTPFQIRMPDIYHFCEDEDGGVMVMQDAGEFNVEQRPQTPYFVEAAKELARLRITAAGSLQQGALQPEVRHAYTVSSNDFLAQLAELNRSPRLSGHPVVLKVMEWLPEQLQRLDHEVSLTLVHHDYNAKNLVIQPDRSILPIDWSNAYLSRHLGDLYCLIKEACSWAGASPEEIIHAYRLEFGSERLSLEHLAWQLQIGGLCWLIRSLRWLVYGGTDVIPGSEAWVPDLLADMGTLMNP